jgi:hypothetical protein
MSMTSCNTEFKQNKFFMTNFRLPGQSRPRKTDGDTVSYNSSVRDAITSVFSARTPNAQTTYSKSKM